MSTHTGSALSQSMYAVGKTTHFRRHVDWRFHGTHFPVWYVFSVNFNDHFLTVHPFTEECPLVSSQKLQAVIKDQAKIKSWIRELR